MWPEKILSIIVFCLLVFCSFSKNEKEIENISYAGVMLMLRGLHAVMVSVNL